MAAIVLAILSLNAFAVRAELERAPTFDEAAYLHASWLMAQGKRPYRDFNEDHAPFLPLMLRAVQPHTVTAEYPKLDVPRFVARARVLTAVLGTLAALAAGLFAWRVTRSRVALVVVLAALLGSHRTFLHGVAEVRNDPPTLFLFWLGALLVASRAPTKAGAVRVGLGVGLLGVAALWNPKWPLETLTVVGLAAHGLFRMQSARLAAWALGTAAAVTSVALGVLFALTTPGDFLFFTHGYNLAFIAWFERSALIGGWFANKPPFFFCSLPFRLYPAASAWLLLAAASALPRVRASLEDEPGWWLVLALVPAAFCELRLLYAWPRLWPQYYLMWSFVVALAFGAVAAALARLAGDFAPARMKWLASACVSGGAAAIAAGAYLVGWRDLSRPPEPSAYFRDVSWVQRHLGAGETVWLGPLDAHPIGAHDASFYWFAFADLVPFSVQFAAKDAARGRLPQVRPTDWPPCRAADNLDRSLRFISREAAALAEPCMKRLQDANRLRETPVPGIVMVER